MLRKRRWGPLPERLLKREGRAERNSLSVDLRCRQPRRGGRDLRLGVGCGQETVFLLAIDQCTGYEDLQKR